MKPKAKTLAERYGFRDPDLKTPKHDDIVLWLMNKENMYDVIIKTYGLSLDITKMAWIIGCVNKGFYSTCKCPYDDRGERLDNEEDWEHRDSRNCPFIEDIEKEKKILHERIQQLSPEKLKQLYIRQMSITAEHPVTTDRDFIIGFIDFLVTMSYPGSSKAGQKFVEIRFPSVYHSYYIEVKTKIDNFGETMRQLNMYRKFISGSMILVVPTLSPELKNAFESQGIEVFTTRSDVGTWLE